MDFNLHIPANALHFFLILGLLVAGVNLCVEHREEQTILPLVVIPLRAHRRAAWVAVLFVIFGLMAPTAVISANQAADKAHFEAGDRAFLGMLAFRGVNVERAAEYGRKSVREFQAAISLAPLDYRYHYRLGWTEGNLWVLEVFGKKSQGVPDMVFERSFRTAIRLYPSNSLLHYGVGSFYVLNWQFLRPEERKFGLSALRKAISLRPELRHKVQQLFRTRKDIDPEILKSF